jgi:nucleotide-binding universal stress UspA family protein
MTGGGEGQTRARHARAAALPELRRVLAPVDFSEISTAAVPFACALAGPEGTVTLLYVIEPVTTPNPLYAHYSPGPRPTPEEREELAARLRGQLAALAPRPAAGRGPRVEVELAEGQQVADCILAVADRLAADAICIASHGRGGLARTLLGSVAKRVLSGARRPVLIVPAKRR